MTGVPRERRQVAWTDLHEGVFGAHAHPPLQHVEVLHRPVDVWTRLVGVARLGLQDVHLEAALSPAGQEQLGRHVARFGVHPDALAFAQHANGRYGRLHDLSERDSERRGHCPQRCSSVLSARPGFLDQFEAAEVVSLADGRDHLD